MIMRAQTPGGRAAALASPQSRRATFAAAARPERGGLPDATCLETA
jgi:hypothetical protein